MAQLPIITAPDPRLKIKARPVPAVDHKIRRLMDDMLDTMYAAIGIGLAAPQVGQLSRVIVLDVAREGEKPQPLQLANPEILWRSPELTTGNEGCLSLPEHYAEVTRPAQIRLRYLDYQNEIREIEASEWGWATLHGRWENAGNFPEWRASDGGDRHVKRGRVGGGE